MLSERLLKAAACLVKAAAILLILGFRTAQALETVRVPLTAGHWTTVPPGKGDSKPDVQFVRHEGFPEGIMVLKTGSVALDGLSFRNGTIEFDLKGIGEDIPGILFRRQGPLGARNAEEFYVRTSPECRASNDCIQYAPVINGFMLWNLYPQYQTQAFILDGWNHIKLVISGHRMNVYINRFAAPALVVGNLESSSTEGAIELRGPATYANLTVAPDAVEGLPQQPLPDPTAKDRGIVRHWQLGPLMPTAYDRSPSYAELPTTPYYWKEINAVRFVMLNLNRSFTVNDLPPGLTWLRSTVLSNRDQEKHVSLGWLGSVWVFVNGKLITQGKNFYDPEVERREPDGRLALANGSFNVPLRRGKNEIVVALYTAVHDNSHTVTHYGWGLEMRYDNPQGLQLVHEPIERTPDPAESH